MTILDDISECLWLLVLRPWQDRVCHFFHLTRFNTLLELTVFFIFAPMTQVELLKHGPGIAASLIDELDALGCELERLLIMHSHHTLIHLVAIAVV